MSDELQILRLRGELLELGSTVRQLKQAGLDGAAAQQLLSRKRAELEDLMTRRKNAAPNLPSGSTTMRLTTHPG